MFDRPRWRPAVYLKNFSMQYIVDVGSEGLGTLLVLVELAIGPFVATWTDSVTLW